MLLPYAIPQKHLATPKSLHLEAKLAQGAEHPTSARGIGIRDQPSGIASVVPRLIPDRAFDHGTEPDPSHAIESLQLHLFDWEMIRRGGVQPDGR